MSSQEPAKLAFNINGAVQASGLGRSSLYTAIQSGELPSLKVGKRRLILPEDLSAWLKSKRTA